MTTLPPKKSDLGVRTLSAVVMLAVAGTALWLGGWWWTVFVAAVALGVLWEWWGLVLRFEQRSFNRASWMLLGAIYVAISGVELLVLSEGGTDMRGVALVISAVIATDVGAYFAGRTIGGPKIAAFISPSKTWSGLCGGIAGASLVVLMSTGFGCHDGLMDLFEGWKSCISMGLWRLDSFVVVPVGAIVAIIAQTGDFFESWMKRRAGVKDSGNLIPGHGGLFDRVDGLLAVLFVLGLFMLAGRVLG